MDRGGFLKVVIETSKKSSNIELCFKELKECFRLKLKNNGGLVKIPLPLPKVDYEKR